MIKDCPTCWYENLDDKAVTCAFCGCKFVALIYNDTEWIE